MITFKQLIEKTIGTEDHSANTYDVFKKKPNVHKVNSKLTDKEKNSVMNYSGTDYTNINHYHRNGKINKKSFSQFNNNEEFINENTKHMDSAISKHIIKHDLHVWRGIQPSALKDIGINHEHTGEHPIIHDKGFVSTSLKPDMAKEFSSTITQHEHVIHIKIPKGSKALYLNHHNASLNRHEHEVLLPRNSKFRYEGSEKHNVATRYHQGTLTVHHLTHIPEEN